MIHSVHAPMIGFGLFRPACQSTKSLNQSQITQWKTCGSTSHGQSYRTLLIRLIFPQLMTSCTSTYHTVMYPQACSKQVCTKKPSCCMLCSSCQQVCNDTTAKFVSVMQQSQVLGNFYAMLAEALRVCCSAHWLASCLSRKMM